MTYEKAKKIAKRIVEDYVDGRSGGEDFGYGLDALYGAINQSAYSVDPLEVEQVIEIFAEHIFMQHTPLAKAMKEEE